MASRTPDYVLAGVRTVLEAVLPLLDRTPGVVADETLFAGYRRRLKVLADDPRAAARSATLAQDLAEIVDGYRAASADPAAVVAGLESVVVAVRGFVPVAAVNAVRARQRAVEVKFTTLVEALAVAGAVRAVSDLEIDSYEQAERLRARLRRLVDLAVERAADAEETLLVRALREAGGWVARDLIERGRPLARIVAYQTHVPLPAVVLAHRLYQDAGRAGELAAQNPGHDHPSFLPMAGKALSR
jgi:prophage DNA circulation protein